jgi:hypothetical protein
MDEKDRKVNQDEKTSLSDHHRGSRLPSYVPDGQRPVG